MTQNNPADKAVQRCAEQQKLPVSYFSNNRQHLQAKLPERSLAIITSGQAPHRTADESYPFWANRNFYYLTGLEQEGLVLLLQNDGQAGRQLLYIQEQDPMYERWRGHRVSQKEAAAVSGLTDIRCAKQLKTDLATWIERFNPVLWLDSKAEDGQASEMKRWLAETCPEQLAAVQDLAPSLTGQRMLKSQAELTLMTQAIDLTGAGIVAMLRRLQPGVMEYHLWAEFARVLADSGCLSPAFASIVASGENIFCLHYMTPYAQIQEGDLVQVDVGATVGNICADISRVFPADGCFSPQQRQIYAIVRRCQETAFSTIRPGIKLATINEACRQTARQGLSAAGLINQEEAITDYFWHNVSHHLGLDVHDESDRDAPLQSGMVLTVEPGIYMPAINVGMRIEDDVLVTQDGCQVLSQAIPREAEEIESLMQQRLSKM